MQDPFYLAGTSIEDRFRVDSVVGEGGFGVVYRGQHLRFDHPIAIKCLKIPAHFTRDARELFLQRFREEGKILLRLGDAPGVPRVFDYGVIERAGAHIPYLVMEWLDGHPLEAMLASRRAAGLTGLRPEDAVQLLLPAIDALAAAHENQIAHRDIKPANLFVVSGARGPTMKVLDFGIAKAMQEGEHLTQAASHTATNFRAFTPNYAAPEQFAPKRYGVSGPWTDVHALGLVLFELLTDRPAYPGDDFVECLEAATADVRPSPRAHGARVSDALEAVVERAVARSAEHRFPHAAALAAAMRQCPEARGGVTGHAPGLLDAPPRTERAPAISAMVGHRPTPPPAQPSGIHATAPFGPLDARPAMTTFGTPATTGQPVSVSRSGSLVPQAPKTSGRAKKQGSSVWPWAIAGLVALGGAAGGGWYLFGKKPASKKKKTASAAVTASAEAPVETKTIYAFDYAIHREAFPVSVISEADAKGKNHVRLTETGGKIVRIERVNPSGAVTSTIDVEHGADGTLTRKVYSGRSVFLGTYRVGKDDVETYVDRTGSTLMNGCARRALKLNDRGDVVEIACQNQEGHVIIDGFGCQLTAFEVNEQHVATSSRCMQEDRRPTTDSVGVHLRRFTHDAFSRVTEESFYGPEGQAVLSTSGCARARFTYDDAHNRTGESCIGMTGFPVPFAGSSAAALAYAHDENGCIVRTSFRDASGNPVSDAGYAGRVFTRDAFCGELSSSTVGPAGALVALPSSAARIDRKLDERGDEIERRCFDDRVAPLNCYGDRSLGAKGSVMRFARDDKGRIVSQKAFDASGAPTNQLHGYPHETRQTYDERGQLVEVRYFGTDGKPALTLGTVAKRTFKYDALGAEVSNAQFGLSGEPVVDTTGSHEVRRTYDAKHRLVSIELRDTTGDYPTKTSIRFGAVIWPLNSVRLTILRDGTRLENRFYDASGKEMKVVDCNLPGQACEL